jgi:hypothetical protein
MSDTILQILAAMVTVVLGELIIYLSQKIADEHYGNR